MIAYGMVTSDVIYLSLYLDARLLLSLQKVAIIDSEKASATLSSAITRLIPVRQLEL
jgi:hypothetical protein